MRNQKHIIDLLKHFVEIGPPGCALTISHKGKVVFEHYEGLADRENGIPITPNTVYRMYSCTKPLTVAAAMILYERGKFLLSDPVEKYLPCFADAKYYRYNGASTTEVVPCKNPITIRSLMNMTCGIPYGGNNNRTEQDIAAIGAFGPASPKTLQDFVKELSQVPLMFEPGTHYVYGYGCDILGAVIEAVSNKSLGEFMKDEIFAPLGMNHTGFFLNEEMRKNLAALYVVQDDGTLVADSSRDGAFEESSLFESGGAGLLSTIGDMTRFSQTMAMGGELEGVRILAPHTINLIRQDHLQGMARTDFDEVTRRVWPNMLGYSFGLACRTLVDPAAAGSCSMHEFAWSGAAGTWCLIDPDRQISAEYAHQLFPSSRNMQDYCHPRLRNAIYGAIID